MKLKDTDAVILMQFRDSVKHLKGMPIDQLQDQMLLIGKPYLERLKKNGYEWQDAVRLMRSVWNSI